MTTPSSRRRSVPSRRPAAVSSAASSRKSDSKKTLSKAIPRRASVLRWPEMTQARVLYQSSSAVRSPPSTRLSSSSAASPRSVSSRVSESSAYSISSSGERLAGGDVVGVADADEVVALFVAVEPGVRVAAAVHDAGHRLAHAAAGVGDQAAALDLPARLGERGGERVADREVAQVTDVQRLRRVRVPELHRVAPPAREVGERRLGAAAGLERGAGRFDPAVLQAQTTLPWSRAARSSPTARARSARARAASPRPRATAAGAARASDRSACAGAAAPAPPSGRLPRPAPGLLRSSQRDCWSYAGESRTPRGLDSQCTSRGSNPDPRRLRPLL